MGSTSYTSDPACVTGARTGARAATNSCVPPRILISICVRICSLGRAGPKRRWRAVAEVGLTLNTCPLHPRTARAPHSLRNDPTPSNRCPHSVSVCICLCISLSVPAHANANANAKLKPDPAGPRASPSPDDPNPHHPKDVLPVLKIPEPSTAAAKTPRESRVAASEKPQLLPARARFAAKRSSSPQTMLSLLNLRGFFSCFEHAHAHTHAPRTCPHLLLCALSDLCFARRATRRALLPAAPPPATGRRRPPHAWPTP